MGNLSQQTWDEIVNSDQARKIACKVGTCKQNCWMVTTARTAMRSPVIPQAPKLKPLFWVLKNKIKVTTGGTICFDEYVDYGSVKPNLYIQRHSYLGVKEKVHLVKGRDTAETRYPLKHFHNQ